MNKLYVQNEVLAGELPDNTPVVIITRHAGLVEWLRQRGVSGSVVSHATEENVRGKFVYGALPMHLAALTLGLVTVDMPLLKPEQRSQDLTPEEMDKAGATMTQYCVIRMS